MTQKPTYAELEQTIHLLKAKNNHFIQEKRADHTGEKKYREFFENAIAGIFQASPDGYFLDVNPAMAKIFGYDSTDDFLKSITNISEQLYLNPQDRETLLDTLGKQGKIFNFEAQQLRKDKTVIWSSISARAVRDTDGNLLYFEGMLIDITKRKQARIQLKSTNEKLEKEVLERKRVAKELMSANRYLENILDNSAEGIGIVDRHGKLIMWNIAAEKLFGMTKNEIKGKSFYQFYPDPAALNKMLYILRKEGFVKGYEIDMLTRDKGILSFEISIAILKDEFHANIGSVCVVRDLSALRKALGQAEAANRAKREFLANLSHEIRTPMNAVLGFAELLDALITDKRQKNYLEAIKSGGKGLLMIINDILDLSTIEAGKLKPRFEPVNIYIICEELQNIFSVKLSSKDIKLKIKIDPRLPEYVMMDEIRLRQILLNLIGNAIKFTDHGFVKLFIRPENIIHADDGQRLMDILISVEDTGVGIPEQDQAKIFDAFTQKEGQDPKIFGGTGLGLAICKRLVEMLNGEISVSSEIGKGSCFFIKFSEIAAAKVPCAEFSDTSDTMDIVFEPASILAVDDVRTNLALINEYLKDTALAVINAQDGEQAWLFAREHHPDLILMDIRMPVMDGYKAARLIKSDDNLKDIPIIAISAVAPDGGDREIEQRGFNKFLRKPITRTALYHLLSEFLVHSHQQRQPLTDTMAETPLKNARFLSELLETLEKKFKPEWEAIRKKPANAEIKQFATAIKQLGEIANVDVLKKYGNDLLFYVQDIDVENTRKTLYDFPLVISQLTSQLKECRVEKNKSQGDSKETLGSLLKECVQVETFSDVEDSQKQAQSILIVDDNPKHIQLIGKTLKEKGYTIEFAMNGEEALKWVSHAHFDLILLDITMPEMNGFDVCRQLKILPGVKDIPIIFLTVKTEINDIVKGFQIGVVDYITKPFNPIELTARVSTHLELKSSRDALKKMALTDGLTQLYNHSYIHERLVQEISLAKRVNVPLSVIMFDLDHFKMVNDTYGHKTGDEILVLASMSIRENIRLEDVAGRYGGEEFFIILPNTDINGASLVAEKIRKKIQKESSKEKQIQVTISGGVCSFENEDANSLIRKADQLLYQAKNTGRNRICTSG